MKQTTFASPGFELVIKRTRKREFLDEMSLVVPWTELTGLIQPFAPASKTGRAPLTIATMLRIHCMQRWFGLLDPAMVEALHDMALFREFAQDALIDKLEKIKASIRAKLEHPFRAIKCHFGYRQTRYRGLVKNTERLTTQFALSNLWIVRKRIIQVAAG